MRPTTAQAQDDVAPLPPFPATTSSPLELVAPETVPDAPLNPDLPPPVVINELHYNHDVDTEWVEFVELHNRAAVAVNISGWTLSGGIGYTFPPGTQIAPRGYVVVAEAPDALRARFNAAAFGPYTGRLSGDGERVVLRDQNAIEVDEVDYGVGFPWPTVGYAPGRSIQLLNPAFDGEAPGNWRSAPPTPLRANSVLVGNAPPQVSAISHSPQQPKQDEVVTVKAVVDDSDGMTSVRLLYQAMPPGQYITLNDSAYQTKWTALNMQPAGDGTYTVQLPVALSKHRTLVRYRVEATDRGNRRIVLPYADDPQPNFAFLVYQGLPIYPASLQPGSPRVTFDFGAMRSLPVYLFLGKEGELADAFFMPPSTWPSGYMGDEYFWRGTLVYNGVVYDHVLYRARGGFARYATGKNMWKVNFNPGHRLQAYDNWGRPYPTKWDKLNLSAAIQQSHRNRRGEQGMFESLTFRLFQLANVPASNTHWAHLRVIDSPYEISGSQYTGDFWGLYLAVEQPDGFFLERNNLPDGNLYKMEYGTGELNNLGRYGPTDKSDLNDFQYAYQYANPSAAWWRATFDLESFYSYRAIVDFAHHYDIDLLKNYIYYRNPESSRWMVLPWDVDLTWYEKMPGTGVDPFSLPVLGNPEFNLGYQNRLRELRDLLLNAEQLFPMLDEYAAVVDTPSNGNSMVDADRFMWDYNPIFDTRYVDPTRTAPGKFYASTLQGTFRAMVEDMKRFALARFDWIDTTLLLDQEHPATPSLTYSGEAGFPVDSLRFVAGEFADPQGPGTFGAMAWRIAEVTHPNAPSFQPGAPRMYEAEAVWESGQLTGNSRTLTPPSGFVLPGHAYRVRVRYLDNSGRWGHWSTPIEFIAGNPRTPVSTALSVTEIMYNPLPEGNIPEDQLEFIEVVNTSSQPVELENWHLSGGVDLLFKPGARLDAGATMLLVRDAGSFRRRYGFDASARYDGRLSNGGDTLTLRDPFGRTVFSVTYGDSAPWPTSADGDGYSLVYNPLGGVPSDPAAWRASTALHGSPGEPDPPPVRMSEVLLMPANQRAVELYNPTNAPADVSGWFISETLGDPRKVLLPPGTVIP
ncbi:MAG: lamin tail domain-containing protein, partial [Caldilineaceae bacterium]